MIGVIFGYLLIVVILARNNADRIENDKRIEHSLNGIAHLSMACILYFVDWRASVALLLSVRVVFDSALNLFRGLSLGYVSPKPASWVDKIEKKIFKNNGYLPKLIYLIIALCLLISR